MCAFKCIFMAFRALFAFFSVVFGSRSCRHSLPCTCHHFGIRSTPSNRHAKQHYYYCICTLFQGGLSEHWLCDAMRRRRRFGRRAHKWIASFTNANKVRHTVLHHRSLSLKYKLLSPASIRLWSSFAYRCTIFMWSAAPSLFQRSSSLGAAAQPAVVSSNIIY